MVDRGPLMLLTPRSACPSPHAYYWEASVFSTPYPLGRGAPSPAGGCYLYLYFKVWITLCYYTHVSRLCWPLNSTSLTLSTCLLAYVVSAFEIADYTPLQWLLQRLTCTLIVYSFSVLIAWFALFWLFVIVSPRCATHDCVAVIPPGVPRVSCS